MPGPLNDIRVVDFTHALNGPFCTMLLGHLGAEVIKIEPPQGDNFRRSWMAPALHARERTGEGQKIVVSMQEAVLGVMVSSMHEHFTGNMVGNTRCWGDCWDSGRRSWRICARPGRSAEPVALLQHVPIIRRR